MVENIADTMNASVEKGWEPPKAWHEEADIVVIGSGFAGLAAAYEAKKAGNSVIIIEKLRVRGGNSIISGGLAAAAGSPLQAQKGIKDSPELLYQDMLKAGLNLNHPDLAWVVAENSNNVVQWTISELGVKYQEELMHLGGHSVPRSYFPQNMIGAGIVTKQLGKLAEIGVNVRTRTYLAKLLKGKDARVRGILVKEDYQFPDEKSGRERLLKARKAVVLATGGFSEDVRFRKLQDPLLGENIDTTNRHGATAEGLLEALRIGATPIQLSWIQMGPWTSPDEKGYGIAVTFNVGVAFLYGVMIDPKTGKRFVNELADRKTQVDAQIKLGYPSIAIADAVGTAHREKFIPQMLKKGVVKRFDTLIELAGFYGIPTPALLKTIDTYNSFVRERVDKEFGKILPGDAEPIVKPPFYACRVWPKVHHTMGGIQINTHAQVIGLDQNPIEGLYAAGEVCGGVHGASRLGSCAVIDCLIFGRIAGQNASSEEPWS
jgi:flavocytochrome c